MKKILNEFAHKLQGYLNQDEELARRLSGFKTFSGSPDGHHRRAREHGRSATARAVRCYPFGGKSQLADGELIGLKVLNGSNSEHLLVALSNKRFVVTNSTWTQSYLAIELPKQLFLATLLGRHRWLWTIAMEEVSVYHRDGLPHSDWVTLLEVLVTLQEVAEFDSELWNSLSELYSSGIEA